MKTFLRTFIFIVCVILSGDVYGLSIVVGPYLQAPLETSMTIMWITDVKCTSWVEYGVGETLDRKAYCSRDGLIDADQTLHRITLEGLTSGTRYSYRVCSKEIVTFESYKVTFGETLVGPTEHFVTLSRSKEAFSFIVLNDIHHRDDLMTKLILQSASTPYDLVFLNGDILGHIEDEPQIVEHILKPCSALFAKTIPFVYVRGNHETRGQYARMLGDYLGRPENRYYYAFDHGPVHFIVMDGGEDKEDGHKEYSGLVNFDPYRERQRVWLEEEIQSKPFKNALFKVVLVHMPPTASKEWHGTNHLYEIWRPLFNRAKIDLMISGHTHQHAVVEPEEGVCDYPMIIGGAPKEGQATVIRVDVTQDTLDVVMTTDEKKVVGAYQVRRNQ